MPAEMVDRIKDVAIISAKDVAGDLHITVQATAGPPRKKGRYRESQRRHEAQQDE